MARSALLRAWSRAGCLPREFKPQNLVRTRASFCLACLYGTKLPVFVPGFTVGKLGKSQTERLDLPLIWNPRATDGMALPTTERLSSGTVDTTLPSRNRRRMHFSVARAWGVGRVRKSAKYSSSPLPMDAKNFVLEVAGCRVCPRSSVITRSAARARASSRALQASTRDRTRILGKTMWDAVRNKEGWKRSHAYARF